MILRNLHSSWYYLKRNPLFTLINLIGLVISITSALFIFIYVSFETSYDRFHKDYEDIYRVIGVDNALVVGSQKVGITMPALGPAMEASIPQVVETVRIRVWGKDFITVDNQKFETQNFVFTEDAFFDVFNFPLLQRQPGVLLDKPRSAVMTQAFAETVFGTEDAMGRLFQWNNQDIEVVGILENVRPDSHMQADLLVSLSFLSPEDEGAQQLQTYLDNWSVFGVVTYARLEPGASELAAEERLTALLNDRASRKTVSATLQPLQEAHLGSSDILYDTFNQNKGDAQKIIMLSSVAIFLLLIAAFNFMNLSTARASLRAKEVGVRKTAGATRSQLMVQFLQESLLLVGFATVLGMVLLILLEPVVSLPLQESFLSYLLSHRQALLVAALGTVVVGLLAGSYPAFILSAFEPVTVLKGKFANSLKGLWLRRVLVVLQFAISIAIIIGTLVVNQQLAYMKNKNPGFERDGIINLTVDDQNLRKNFEVLKNRLLALPQVLAVAGTNYMPGELIARTGITAAGGGPENFFMMNSLYVDSEYLDILSMKLVAGRNYAPEFSSDVTASLILNQSAISALGWSAEEAIGQTLRNGETQRTIVGVVEDFHFADMRQQIEPVVLFYREQATRLLSIRIDKTAPREAIEGITAAWREINPDYPFSYTFFTDEYNELFRKDAEFSAMLNQFTFIAIIIACLGLYGLASFSVDQKTKEIGIRKVLGAHPGSLLKVVLTEYIVLIVVANLLAWGTAWYVMQQWLSGFAYRIDIPVSGFLVATVGTTLLAVLTVGREIFKVVKSKPVDSLRYE